MSRAGGALAAIVLVGLAIRLYGLTSYGIWFDESYGYLMLFTGDSLPDKSRRRRSLGVEPMTCAPNAFASGDGLQMIDPGETVSASWGITAVRDAAGA